MYCINCGKQIDDNLVRYPHCSESNNKIVCKDDTGSFIWAILGLFIPLAGLILWLIWKKEKPKSAKMAGIGCLINIISKAFMFIFIIIEFLYGTGIADIIVDKIEKQGMQFIMQAKSLFIK